MRVLRSRKVGSGDEIESQPPPPPAKEANEQTPPSSLGLRRSARLCSNNNNNNDDVDVVGGSATFRGKRKAANFEERGKEFGSVFEANVTISTKPSVRKVKSQRVVSSSLDLEEDGDVCSGLRSGKKLSKPEINNPSVKNNGDEMNMNLGKMEEKGKEKVVEVNSSGPDEQAILMDTDTTLSLEEVVTPTENNKMDRFKNVARENASRFAHFSIQEEEEDVDEPVSPHKEANVTISTKPSGRKVKSQRVVSSSLDLEEDGDVCSRLQSGKKLSKPEINNPSVKNNGDEMNMNLGKMEGKGKEKVVEVNSSGPDEQAILMDTDTTLSLEEVVTPTENNKMDRFKNVARENASRFAHFSIQEEEEDVDEPVSPHKEANGADVEEEEEDWPGPISTAFKIIKDRALNKPSPAEHKNKTTSSKSTPLIWVPKKHGCRFKVSPPSLEELCINVMADNVDAITSLESVPDVIRHKLTQGLCDSRKMNHHFFNLLASSSPYEIRIKDCSWLDEDQFIKTFQALDATNLTVLQLDQCGRCLPDYVLYTTLSHLPSKLSALTNISLKGACRLSDTGLNALVTSASALRSINLGCCSLLTSDAIINLADKLGPVLKELYIDECFGIDDAKSILPALFNLQQLEVLSISHFETVNDTFITQFVAVQGHKMKELVLADCTKLTDKALKAIAKNCPDLCAIDLSNLCKLTDASLAHLANGCQKIQTVKFCRNAFSDEAVAAYLEACGGSLTEVSLNHVVKVANHTALSLAKHAKKLQRLDLSWCREMSDEAVGLIVDSCLSLKTLKLFGCTQITSVFTEGHSNEIVKIIGLHDSQILKNIVVPDLLPLRYSSTV